MSHANQPEFSPRGIARIFHRTVFLNSVINLVLLLFGLVWLLLNLPHGFAKPLGIPLLIGGIGLMIVLPYLVKRGCQQLARGRLPRVGWWPFWSICLFCLGWPALFALIYLIVLLIRHTQAARSTAPGLTLVDKLIAFDWADPYFLVAATITLWSLAMSTLAVLGMLSPIEEITSAQPDSPEATS